MANNNKTIAIQRHLEELTNAEQIISDSFSRMEKDSRFNLDFETRSALEESRYNIRKVLSQLRNMQINLKDKE